jgi:hypothetical protein
MFGSGEELPQTQRQGNGDSRLCAVDGRYLSGPDGQLSLIQRVRLSSLTSPAARDRIIAAASASGTMKIHAVYTEESVQR